MLTHLMRGVKNLLEAKLFDGWGGAGAAVDHGNVVPLGGADVKGI